jgi:hypothetical protein
MREQDKTINVTAWPPLINFDRWLTFYLEIFQKKFSIKNPQTFQIFNYLFLEENHLKLMEYRG